MTHRSERHVGFRQRSHQMQDRIPKRIIQTGKHAQQPLRSRAVMSNMKLLNPGYEYLFFDNLQQREFVALEFPHYVEIFDSFRFVIQRCDFFRYLAVYRYGGFYFDADDAKRHCRQSRGRH